MRWPIFLFAAFVFLVLDSSLMNALALPTLGHVAPNLVVCLAVYVCLFATRLSALSTCLLLGILLDLTLPPRGQVVYVIGPYALGLLFGGYLVLQLRTMVFRQRALTIGVLTAVASLAAGVVMIAIFVVRSWYGEGIVYPTHPSAARELLRQFGIAIYSGLVAIPIGWLLLASYPLWGFQAYHSRRVMVR